MDILPDPSKITSRPHHADDPRQNDAAWVDFADQPTEPTDAARRRAQKTQLELMRRRRAELTPSNKDLDKTQNTQPRRRRRAELSPEDAQRRKAMDTLWRRRLNSARAAGRGRVLESMS